MADINPFAKYKQQAKKPVAAPSDADRIQAIAKRRVALDRQLNPSGLTSAAESGLMSWLPFEAGTRLAAGINYLTGGEGKSYQDQLAIERATEALERQRSGAGEKVLERGLIELLKRRRRAESGIHVFLEVAAEIYLVEGIFLGLLLCLFRGAPFAIALFASNLFQTWRIVFNFFQNGVFDDFRIDHLLQLKLV